jgi:hypothetical protein
MYMHDLTNACFQIIHEKTHIKMDTHTYTRIYLLRYRGQDKYIATFVYLSISN